MTDATTRPTTDSSSAPDETNISGRQHSDDDQSEQSGLYVYVLTSFAVAILTVTVGIIILFFRKPEDTYGAAEKFGRQTRRDDATTPNTVLIDLVEVPTKQAKKTLHMPCSKDSDCDEENFLVCSDDETGWEKTCVCGIGYVEKHKKCAENEMRPGDKCDLRFKCAKSTNMVCDRLATPPVCVCMRGMHWEDKKCVVDFEYPVTEQSSTQQPNVTTD